MTSQRHALHFDFPYCPGAAEVPRRVFLRENRFSALRLSFPRSTKLSVSLKGAVQAAQFQNAARACLHVLCLPQLLTVTLM